MTTPGAAREFELIERVFRRGTNRPDVVVGIGDDAAITRLPADAELVTATDTLVCGTHFVPDAPAESVGHRVLAANLSDIAAMGAEPLWASLAITLTEPDMRWLEAFAQGLFELADKFGVELIGGDTVRGALAATITLQGKLPRGSAITRAGAAEGDWVFVTGSPGDAAAGRLLLAGELAGTQVNDNPGAAATRLMQRFLFPEPRVAMGMRLRSIATAMIDVSDGLLADLGHLLHAGGVGADVELAQLPVSDALIAVADASHARELALCGGEDYELCFTAPPAQAGRINQIAAELSCSVSQIGIVNNTGKLSWLADGVPVAVPDSAFRHFG
jgi:thiamine-monophosphate kinase